jgi:hypothetical protein
MKQKCKASGDRTIKYINGLELWTAKRAADYLAVTKPTIYKYSEKSHEPCLPKVELDGLVFFERKSLDGFINKATSIGIANRKINRKGGTL